MIILGNRRFEVRSLSLKTDRKEESNKNAGGLGFVLIERTFQTYLFAKKRLANCSPGTDHTGGDVSYCLGNLPEVKCYTRAEIGKATSQVKLFQGFQK